MPVRLQDLGPAAQRQAIEKAIKYAQDEKLRKAFAKQAERLAPLQWEHGGLLITPAQNEGQLIAEGKILGHCVGGYGESHCKSVAGSEKAEYWP